MANKTGDLPGIAAKVNRAIWFIGLAVLTLLCVAWGPPAPGRITTPVPEGLAVDGSTSDKLARQLFTLLNTERTEAGLLPLTWDDGLAAAAQQHTLVMAEHRELSHQFSDEAELQQRLANVPLTRLGENVAVDDGGVVGAHASLMRSPPHRAAILDSEYNAVGIGAVQAGRLLWVTQDFALRIMRMSDQAAADMVAAAFLRERSAAGLPSVSRRAAGSLSRNACNMSRLGRPNAEGALDVPGAYSATAYTSSDPGKLPEEALRFAREREVRRIAVGVCFARGPNYPNGVYWILMVLFNS